MALTVVDGPDWSSMTATPPVAWRVLTWNILGAQQPNLTVVADVPRLEQSLDAHRNGEIVLVGRRQLRSNNSWMHNLPLLARGQACTLHVHPEDAERLGLEDGGTARVRARAGEVEATVEVTDRVMPGVVSLPHGWGHDQQGAELRVAAAHAGVNSNVLADELEVDPLSGNAVLSGIPVELAAVGARAAAGAAA